MACVYSCHYFKRVITGALSSLISVIRTLFQPWGVLVLTAEYLLHYKSNAIPGIKFIVEEIFYTGQLIALFISHEHYLSVG
jgi:hypothetical protein